MRRVTIVERIVLDICFSIFLLVSSVFFFFFFSNRYSLVNKARCGCRRKSRGKGEERNGREQYPPETVQTCSSCLARCCLPAAPATSVVSRLYHSTGNKEKGEENGTKTLLIFLGAVVFLLLLLRVLLLLFLLYIPLEVFTFPPLEKKKERKSPCTSPRSLLLFITRCFN